MQSDGFTRTLLVLILACLLALVVQGWRRDAQGMGRFQVMGMRAGSPVLIRNDTATGEVWKLELRGGGNRWIPFTEGTAVDDDETEATPREPAPRDAARIELTPDDEASLDPPELPAPAASLLPAASGDLEADVASYAGALRNGGLPADVRAWAAKQLGALDHPRATRALVRALDAPEPKVVSAAVAALSDRDEPSVTSALEKMRAHPDAGVRALVLEQLGEPE